MFLSAWDLTANSSIDPAEKPKQDLPAFLFTIHLV